MNTPEDIKRQRYIAIGLAVLFAVVMTALGAFSIWDESYVGKTRQSNMVAAVGTTARWMGAFQICVGMLMLGIAMPSKKTVIGWMVTWLVLGMTSVALALHYAK